MGETVKRLPNIVWAYAAHAWTISIRLWALPFVVGWVCGVIAMAWGFGCAIGLDLPLGKWASDLRYAHRPRPAQLTDADLIPPGDDSFDDEDESCP